MDLKSRHRSLQAESGELEIFFYAVWGICRFYSEFAARLKGQYDKVLYFWSGSILLLGFPQEEGTETILMLALSFIFIADPEEM